MNILYLFVSFPPSSIGEREEPRRSRLAQLCTYLQERYKHLCRQERAATRYSRYKYAFRKALLHAASKDPDCTGELIQQLSKTSHTSSRYRKCVCVYIRVKIWRFREVKICFMCPRCAVQQELRKSVCTGSTKGQPCSNPSLPFTRHCFQRILLPYTP